MILTRDNTDPKLHDVLRALQTYGDVYWYTDDTSYAKFTVYIMCIKTQITRNHPLITGESDRNLGAAMDKLYGRIVTAIKNEMSVSMSMCEEYKYK